MAKTTWRAELTRRMALTGERVDDLVAVEPEGALDLPFDNGRHRDAPLFFAWTAQNVYFPTRIDGYPRAGSAPRYPKLTQITDE